MVSLLQADAGVAETTLAVVVATRLRKIAPTRENILPCMRPPKLIHVNARTALVQDDLSAAIRSADPSFPGRPKRDFVTSVYKAAVENLCPWRDGDLGTSPP
jgi:hypothetical protein